MNPLATPFLRVLAAAALVALVAWPLQAQDRGVIPGWAGAGAGIVEVANPGGDPCPDLTVSGCLQYGGNTVWHDGNIDGDYYVSAGGGTGEVARLERYAEAAADDQFEVRFTADGGLAAYGFADGQIAAVPFELWNIGDPADPADDVRMIPFLNANDVQLLDWEDEFTGLDPWPLGGDPITDWIYAMMPDRPDGYDLFEAAALGFGGPGAIYDPTMDGDTQVDPDPFLGGDCANQGWYVDFCYMNQDFVNNPGGSSFIYPIGRLVFADLAGDGTTPEEGVVVRLIPDTGAPTFADWADNGAGIVETASPAGDPCADPGQTGCEEYEGNTVWHDPNVNDDWYVSGGGGDGSLDRLRRYVEAAIPDVYEMRFTADGGYAAYGFIAAPFPIAEVPFELWNIGDPTDPADDVRMIPFLNNNADPLTDWEDQFTGTDAWALADATPITDWVYWMQPDRPDGYDLFEAAALGFGGAGALYDPTMDGDTQVDSDPSDGGDCDNQGVYVDYCFRNDVLTGTYAGGDFGSQFVYPIGRMVFGDLAGDGTTPLEGTVIRLFPSGEIPVVDVEDGPEAPDTFALLPVAPNPLATQARVAFSAPEAGHVRVSVYDLLGREVAVLADGVQPAGRHEATLDAGRLASGVYVVVMEAEGGARATQKVTVLR